MWDCFAVYFSFSCTTCEGFVNVTLMWTRGKMRLTEMKSPVQDSNIRVRRSSWQEAFRATNFISSCSRFRLRPRKGFAV